MIKEYKMALYKKIYIGCFVLTGIFISGCQSEAKIESVKEHFTEQSLFKLIQLNDVQVLQKRIDPKHLEQRNSQGETLLMYAIYQKKWDIAKFLIESGADVNAQDHMKNSPFLYAGAEGYLDIVKLALQHNPNFGLYNRYGGTALIPAAEKGHIEMVRLLANVPHFPINHVNHLGWTALMEAVFLGDGGNIHVEIVKILLEAGADRDIPDKNGVTALQHAERNGFKQMAQVLSASS